MPTLPSLRSLREATSTEEPQRLMTITRGGLGNILFQWLATEATALDNKKPTTTSYLSGTTDKRPDITTYEMFSDCETFESLDIPRSAQIYKEPSFLYKSIPIHDKQVYVLDGYFQSWRHFYHHRSQLARKLRTHGGQALLDAESWLERTREQHQGKRLVGVHVRQGDYLSADNCEKHYVCDSAYWERALRTAIAAGVVKDPEHDVFFVASDDPVAVKKMHAFKGLQAAGYQVLWLPPGDDPATTERTFWCLAGADSLLVSNSSFSLGAWMCRDRESQLIAPARWFAAKGPAFKINDILPGDTLLVE